MISEKERLKKNPTNEPVYMIECPSCGVESMFYAADFDMEGKARCQGFVVSAGGTTDCERRFKPSQCTFMGKL